MNPLRPTLRLALFALLAAQAPAATVWIEGESFIRSNRQYIDWMEGNSRDLISGGQSAAFLDRTDSMSIPLYILWRFEVAEAGTYAIHFRSLGLSLGTYGRTRFRIIPVDPATGSPLTRPPAQEGWTPLDRDGVTSDRVPAGDVRVWEWSRQGEVYLEPGSYLLDLQTLGATDGREDIWGGFDAILLTTDLTYAPRGKVRPN